MKVVLFCGGLGTRLREYSESVPKPLVNIGHRPLVWHLMRYYAYFGHTEFILCLGYRGDLIREYFLNYNEALSNDFTLENGGRRLELHSSDLDNWKITFVDTGLNSNIGQRLLRARRYLMDEEVFLANYADALSDLPLDEHMRMFISRQESVASFAAVVGNQSFHFVNTDNDNIVTRIASLREQQLWINGGFFIFRKDIFSYINEGDELVEAPFARLVARRKLMAYPWDGFWHCMDTLKDKTSFDGMEASGRCRWKVWQKQQTSTHIGARCGYESDLLAPRPITDVEPAVTVGE
jgi:glucose-1-phosphate cytidylyltransferase